jgi:signal transduction histidine kinase
MPNFKARARALDMLGKQQIAGIPTAISELFKNAYDAYADNVIVDYFRTENLIVLRDDGFGMTKYEFENRWLTIGTESKVKSPFGSANIAPPIGKDPRPVMGEKGIGRLAIAMLGSQVLVLTRALREGEIHKFVASFINWSLFELPGLNLEDIYIPVKEFDALPNHEQILTLIAEAETNAGSLSGKIEESLLNSILEDMSAFKNINIEKKERNLEEPCKFNDDSAGTRFYIFPSNPLIADDLEGNISDDDAPYLKKMLIGFTDDVMPGHNQIQLKAHFRDYKYPEYYEDVIAETNFFTEDEFKESDHLFTGRFNEFGQFIGRVKIFGKEQDQEYVIPWTKNKGKTVECGPFEIVVMTIQGIQSESLLGKETHAKINDKLYKYGGIYIYKDGIRILPYGNNQNDFLDIEYRRSKHAGIYYWSYRRLLGAVRLNSGINDSLKEKAGREGFQQTKAFRDMRDILINFFIQTAKDFFNEKGDYSDFYRKIKTDNIKRDELLKRDEKNKKKKKDDFSAKLYEVLNLLDTNGYEDNCNRILNSLNGTLSDIDTIGNRESAALKLIEAERRALEKLYGLKSSYSLSKPRGVSFSKKVEYDYNFYKNKIVELEQNIFYEARRNIELLIGEKSRNAQLELDRRRRIEESLLRLSTDAKKQIQEHVKDTDETLADVMKNVGKSTKESLGTVEKVIRSINFSLGQTDFTDMNDKDIYSWRMDVENKIISVMETEKKELETIKALLDNVKWEKDEEGNIVSYIDVLEAGDSKLNELKEKSEADSDLAQLGMAVNIINHEFDASIKMVRENLRRLKAWADVNQGLDGIYSGIKSSFDHLDSYLTLFTPLNRRLQRKTVEIRGHEIEEFIIKLFGERFKRHHIEINSSMAFRQSVINVFPSSIYPVFVNIIDNATYWIKGKTENGIIDLDIDDYGFIISNNGSGIPERDRDTIFEMGFTRKPGGRGLGLYISSEALKEQGMSLELVEPKKGFSVSFRIIKSGST